MIRYLPTGLRRRTLGVLAWLAGVGEKEATWVVMMDDGVTGGQWFKQALPKTGMLTRKLENCWSIRQLPYNIHASCYIQKKPTIVSWICQGERSWGFSFAIQSNLVKVGEKME